MLTTTPYLRIRRPSPTAVEFTVSTLPPSTTSLRLALATITLVRVALNSMALLVLYATWAGSSYNSPSYSSSSSNIFHTITKEEEEGEVREWWWLEYIKTILDTLLASPPGTFATYLSLSASDPRVVVAVCVAVLYVLNTRRLHAEESLLVLRGLGIQTRSGVGDGGVTRFIPTGKIRDVLINEAFRGFGVRHYLAIVVDDEPDVVVVFPQLLPRRDVVEKVWRGVRECLYERKPGGDNVGGDGLEVGE